MCRICNNCKNYNPDCYYNQCEAGYGNIYPQDHGCWQWVEKDNKKIKK